MNILTIALKTINIYIHLQYNYLNTSVFYENVSNQAYKPALINYLLPTRFPSQMNSFVTLPPSGKQIKSYQLLCKLFVGMNVLNSKMVLGD